MFNLPIKPKHPETPVIAINRWTKLDGTLTKTYTFKNQEMKYSFVVQLLKYELKVKHCADIKISEQEVDIVVSTKDINQITELDKEYAKFADVIFKELMYNFVDGSQ